MIWPAALHLISTSWLETTRPVLATAWKMLPLMTVALVGSLLMLRRVRDPGKVVAPRS